MRGARAAWAGLLIGTGVLLAADAGGRLPPPATAAQWREVPWPLPLDPWGRGRAFRCDARHCGVAVTLIVRPKVGLCGCKGSIDSDEELERLVDLEVAGRVYRGGAPGRALQVGRLPGWGRGFDTLAGGSPAGASQAAFAVGYHERCDLIVATAWTDGPAPPGLPRTALQLLESRAVTGWLETRLGL